MDLRAAILEEHSKENTAKLAAWTAGDPDRIHELVQLFLHDEYRVVQRAAWILSVVAESTPALIAPYIGLMLQRCTDEGIPVAVKRNVTRILQRTDIPEEHHGTVMNLCFDLLADPKETIAVRCFSMGILAQLCQPYPELKQELKSLIENALEHEEVSAGFRSKSRRVLKEI